MSLIQRIDALLPQTQCGKCGHPGCRPYAEGLAAGEAINKCPPGGSETIQALASLLDLPVIAPDPQRGSAPPQVAFIREAECIGCTKCIQACPVDAIVGAAKLMHTVIAAECTGCDLCLAPCPVDCIDMLPVPPDVVPVVGGLAHTPRQLQDRQRRRDQARHRHEQRAIRLLRDEARREAQRAARHTAKAASAPDSTLRASDPIKAAMERVQAQQASNNDAALKQAKIAAAMSRAQLSKARTALGATPSDDQLAQLQTLQAAADQAQQHLDALQAGPGNGSA
ncbi:electron transport complex subunit RsxB [Pseudomonas sp. SK2]|nr:lectron transport complex protein RnfB [Pseudomonas sp. VLB120]QQZ37388.1 electron transport complex subunit RsxB [Pseudomonas sp. SK2]